MSTIIPVGGRCYSACAYIFFAGKERLAEGQLGVHQIASERHDNSETQLVVSDILYLLHRFGTPAQVLTIMFRIPPEEMYVISSDEIARPCGRIEVRTA